MGEERRLLTRLRTSRKPLFETLRNDHAGFANFLASQAPSSMMASSRGGKRLRFPVSIVLMSALAHVPAHAQNDQVKRGPAPDWVVPGKLMAVPANASGLMFVRNQDVLVHLDAQGQAQYLGYRIRILHSNALQIGNISLVWNPAAGAPTVHVIKVHRGNEVIDVLEKATFEILRREDQLEAASLDGNLTAVLHIADLRVGDELEFSLTTRKKDPVLGNDDAGLLGLMPNPPAGRFHLGLSWAEGQRPATRMTPDLAAIAQVSERAVDFRFDNPAVLAPPKDAPPRHNWQRIVQYSAFADWAAISRRFVPLYAKASKLADGSPLKLEARRIAAAHTGPLDQASAALKLVQQDVRYIYVGLDGGNLMPAAAEVTWQRRYGDCKAKTVMLLALLAELGIEAEAVLVNNSGADDGLDERLPNPGAFDHVLVRARINGAVYWLDGTLPAIVPPSAVPLPPYKWVLPLTARGSSLEQLAWHPAKTPDEITLHEIDARAGFDQPARIKNTSIIRGIKGVQQQVEMSAVTPGQLLASLRQQLIGDTWQTIDDVQWHYDQKAQASVLTISGMGTVDWETANGGVKSLQLPGGGFNPPQRRVRSADQNQDIPYYIKPEFSCAVTTVRIPAATQAKQWSFNSGFDTRIFGQNYYRALELRDGSIRMVRGNRVEHQEIDAASARRDNDRIAAFDNSMAQITYYQFGRTPPSASAKAVPATDEINWTANSVPCLAAPKTDKAS